MGYKTLKVVPKYHTRATTPVNMFCGINTMENEYLKVKINSNGMLMLLKRKPAGNTIISDILRTPVKMAARGNTRHRGLMRNIQLLMNGRL